jgi:cell division protein FtsN
MYDKVIVDLPYSVTIQDKTLTPGEYVIRQSPSEGQNRVVMIFSQDGTQLETTALTIPTLSNRTPDDTSVVLHHFGNDYYFDKIWVQGKNYGYEFPLPDAVKARQRERAQSVTVAASYEAVPAKEEPQQVAQAAPPPPPPAVQEEQPAPAPAPEAAPAPAPAPEPAPVAEAPAAPVEMPHTNANWLALILSGGMLTGAGLLFRRS